MYAYNKGVFRSSYRLSVQSTVIVENVCSKVSFIEVSYVLRLCFKCLADEHTFAISIPFV